MVSSILQATVLFSLPEKEYKQAGSSIKLAPCLAVIKTDDATKKNKNDLDIGLYLGSTEPCSGIRFWGFHFNPLNAVQAYRALKLLEICPRLEDDTLCACYYAMSRNLDETSKHYLQSLKESSFEDVEECRQAILSEVINESYFVSAFLQPLLEFDVPINSRELHKEIALGKITTRNIEPFITRPCLRERQAVI